MNKFFYTLYISPLFISASLLAQEATLIRPTNSSKKKTNTGTYMPLLDPVDLDLGETPSAYSPSTYNTDAYASTASQTIDQQTAQSTAQPAYTFAAPASTESQTIGQQAAQGVPQYLYHTEALRAQQNRIEQAAATFDPSFNPRIAAPAPAPMIAAQHATNAATSSTSHEYNMVQLEESKPRNHSQYCVDDKVATTKKIARAHLMMIMRTFYTHIDSSTSRDAVKKALKKQIATLKTEFPAEKEIDRWFLNEPIDQHGNTMAHVAALNGDHAFLEMLYKMGVDVFKPNNENNSPEQLAHKHFITDSPLTEEQKNLLLGNESTEKNLAEDQTIVNESIESKDGKQKKKVKRKVANNTTITTVTPLSVEQQRAQEKYHTEKEVIHREALQRRYERFKSLELFYHKIKSKKK